MATITITEKICSKCKLLKVSSEFSKRSDRSIGLRSDCKICSAKENKEKSSQPFVLTQKVIDRFFTHVVKTDNCWNWTGPVKKMNYGRLKINHRMILAHRLSYLIHNGEFAQELLVCHTCDNPNCVNPEHLFLGTHKDNADDMWSKGRANPNPHRIGAKGSKSPRRLNHDNYPNSKLNEEKAAQIRFEFFEQNRTNYELAEKYGVTFQNIRAVILNRIWKAD